MEEFKEFINTEESKFHEANLRAARLQGCKIIDYSKYRRSEQITAILLLFAIVLYFFVGFVVGHIVASLG